MAGASPQKILNDKIKSELLRPSLTSHYICRFQPPNEMGSFLSDREGSGWIGANYSSRINQDLIEISCSEASLPGSSLMTNEINDDFTGVTERHAYRRQYDNQMDFTFYVDHDYRIINFFESWISRCSGEDNQTDLSKREYSYRVYFPDDYQTDGLYITKFEKDLIGPSLEYQFIRAYPISIASMPVSYDSSQLLKCTVSFTFIRYLIKNRKIEKEQEPTQSTTSGSPLPSDGKSIIQNLPVIGDVNGNGFPLGPGIPGLTGILNPNVG